MHRRIRRAYTSIVEQGCNKIATIGCLSNLDLLLAKATSPDDIPLPERYVWELATIFSSSPSSCRSFALSFTRRFGRTRLWRVALKCLLLLHRLLRTLPSDHPFRADLLSARANALISFHPCHFRNASSASPVEYTSFIRSYAHLLDEVLSCYHSITGEPPSPGQAMELVHQLHSLVDRAMDCVPAGAAARSFLVMTAMKQVVRESFACYLAARQSLAVVLDGILQMPYQSCVQGLSIYKRAAEQAVRLGEFYQWCRRMGLCGPYEYPLVEKIPKIQVLMLEGFVEQMWHLTESSSTSSPITSLCSPTSAEVEGNCRDTETAKKVVISGEWEKFEEEEEEEEPLIRFEEDDELGREVLLEASVGLPWTPHSFHEPWRGRSREDKVGIISESDDHRSLRVFNPYLFNPFFWS